MTRAGETGGVLESSMLRVADQLEKEDSLRRQVKSAMTYPIVVLSFAFGILIALVTFLVPVFVGVFKQFGGDLPFITKITVAMSAAVTGYWWAVHRRDRARSCGPSASGSPATRDAGSGTRSACASR